VHDQEAFKRERYELLFMDTWTDDELRNARDVLYPNISDTELNDRIYRYVIDGHCAASWFCNCCCMRLAHSVEQGVAIHCALAYESHTLVTFSVCMICLRNSASPMCSSLFNCVNAATLLVGRWGGNARYVLREHAEDNQVLADAVKATVLANIKHPASGEGLLSTNPHTVIHVRAGRDLKRRDVTIGSRWAMELIVEQAFDQRLYDLYTFVGLVAPGVHFDGYPSGRGTLWEVGTQLRLMRGGEFRQRNSAGDISSVTLPHSAAVLMFANVTDSKGLSDFVYCRPFEERYPLIDSLRQPTDLYQFTIAKWKDPYDPQHLWTAISSLNCKPHNVKVYWVVPPNRFYTFKVPKSRGLESLCEEAQKAIESVQHIVLEVDLEAHTKSATS
jgi:hypothetical protein